MQRTLNTSDNVPVSHDDLGNELDADDGQAMRASKGKPREKRRSKKMSARRLHNIALAYLDRYEASETGLRRILERRVWKAARAHDEDPQIYQNMIEAEVETARNAGYVNDKRFAENQVYQQRGRGASARAIAARLKSKGVDESLIFQALDDDERDDEQAALRYAQRRRLGPFRLKGRAERRERDMAALCRAGFALDTARKIIDSASDDAPDGMTEDRTS
ncbi:MAG: regulatory protein RecX [Pseudomonadota bacterium]